MTGNLHFRAFVLLALLVLLLPSRITAQETRGDAPSGVAEARRLFNEGRYRDSLAVLRSLAQARPGDKELRFLIGLAATQASQRPKVSEAEREALLDEAIASFRAILIDEPAVLRVRLELARAFFLKREDGLARRHFERVLAGKPPAAVVANVRRFLTQIRERKRWQVNVGFALLPDNNIGAKSDRRVIHIYGLPFRLSGPSPTKSGMGLSLWGRGEYKHPVAERVRLRAGAEAARKEYSSGEYDQMTLSGYAGPQLFLTRNADFSVLGTAEYRWSANVGDYHELGLRTEAQRRLGRRLLVRGHGAWKNRRHRIRTHLDGPILDFSLDGSWFIDPTLRTDISGGYGRERPRSPIQRNFHWRTAVGLSWFLPRGFTVGGRGEFRWTDFRGNWFPYTRGNWSRRDRTRTWRISVHNRGFTLFGFSPEVALLNETRKSNAQLHDYKRTGGELRFVRQF